MLNLWDPDVQAAVRELVAWYEEWGYETGDLVRYFTPHSMRNRLLWRQQPENSVARYE